MTDRLAYRVPEVCARTVKDFCKTYGIGRTATYELINAGRLQARKFGKRTLIMEESARAWFESLAHIHVHISTPVLGERKRTGADGRSKKAA